MKAKMKTPRMLPVKPVVIRCKDGNYMSSGQQYERLMLETKKWLPITVKEVKMVLDSGMHILWNPPGMRKKDAWRGDVVN